MGVANRPDSDPHEDAVPGPDPNGPKERHGRPGMPSIEHLSREASASSNSSSNSIDTALPPILGRLFTGTAWLALRTPLQVFLGFWSIRLTVEAIGPDRNGAYNFAWGFGFVQFLLEFGMGSALQRQISETWTKGDRGGVDRALACGLNFYAAVAVIQAAVLLAVAFFALPLTEYQGDSYNLIFKLLWLQALSAPCYGLTMVVTSVLQAARRFEVIPRCEMLVVLARFAILWFGLQAGFDFFLIVLTQTLAHIALSLVPATYVMVKELGYFPSVWGARWDDFSALLPMSFYIFLIQLSVVLADKVDTTILGFALTDPGPATTIYQIVSKPFLQIRQTGWTLTYLVMPAVASLAAARDLRNLERLKYDGPRLHVGVLLPVTLLAWLYAAPFLDLWIPGSAPHAWLLRLFLVATAPLVISVFVQMSIGMGRIKVIALSALAGSVVNLPLSYYLTVRLGDASGVIWGTVVTTLFSNLLIPGMYVFRGLEIQPSEFFRRTLAAPACGALALLVACLALKLVYSPMGHGPNLLVQAVPFLIHLAVGCTAYGLGYTAVSSGRGDVAALTRRFRGTTESESE